MSVCNECPVCFRLVPSGDWIADGDVRRVKMLSGILESHRDYHVSCSTCDVVYCVTLGIDEGGEVRVVGEPGVVQRGVATPPEPTHE